MNFGNFLMILLSLSLTGCSGLFHLDAGARQSTYTEEPKNGDLEQTLSQATNRTIVIREGDKSKYEVSGMGYHVGLNYETQFLMQKIQYYAIDYDQKNYQYSINGSSPVDAPLNVSATGFDYQVGFKLGIFRPRVSLKQEDLAVDTTLTQSNDTMLFFGYGLGIDFHFVQGLHLYVTWDKRLRVGGDDKNFNISSTDISFGLMFRPWDWFSFGSGSKAAKPYTSPFFDVF
jgi:hypothetical protein